MSKFYYLILLIAFLQACTSKEDLTVNIPDEFTIQLIEPIQKGGSGLILHCTSVLKFPCRYDSLSYVVSQQEGKWTIDLGKLPSKQNCDDIPIHIQSNILLPDIGLNEAFDFTISLDHRILNEGTITQHEDYYDIALTQDKGIILNNQRVNKIPHKMIWGWAYSKEQKKENAGSTEAEITELLKKLKNEMEAFCGTQKLQPGFYSYFDIGEDKTIRLKDIPTVKNEVISFYYKHEYSEEIIFSFFEQILPNYNNLIAYRIQTSDGRIFESL
ncbi:MAG: hypothetical protein M3Q56_06845 [Bacteroidota bacterium]|nr:hypothetical protein [Bacteroidota bacterium]